MKMQVGVGERAHPLDRGDSAGLAARDAAVTRAAAMIRRHDAHEHGQHRLGWLYVASGRNLAVPICARLAFQLGATVLESLRLVG